MKAHFTLADVFEGFIEMGGRWKIVYENGKQDTVSFKDIYLDALGLKIIYFSWNEKILKTDSQDQFLKISGKSLEDWLNTFYASEKELQPKVTNPTVSPFSSQKHSPTLVFSVTEFTEKIKKYFNKSYKNIWIRGEISDLNQSSNGHFYFNLKDNQAVISCVIFKRQAQRFNLKIEEGINVEALGNLVFYEKRGACQFIINLISFKGKGDLLASFHRVKQKLENEGLFDSKYKQKIPRYPGKVGLITSPYGAAIVDVIKSLELDISKIEVIIYPSKVQGEGADIEMAKMVEKANEHNFVDLLIITRGGGSEEDLSAFNSEFLAKSVFESKIPIISAIGHEVDMVILDLVVDFRCSTPTSAGEQVAFYKKQLIQNLAVMNQQLLTSMNHRLLVLREKVSYFSMSQFAYLISKLVYKKRERVEKSFNLIFNKINEKHLDYKKKFLKQSTALEVLSPLKVLSKGYSVIKKGSEVINDGANLKKNDEVNIQFYKGSKKAKIL